MEDLKNNLAIIYVGNRIWETVQFFELSTIPSGSLAFFVGIIKRVHGYREHANES